MKRFLPVGAYTNLFKMQLPEPTGIVFNRENE